jgi:surfeit locus 1 family protein
MEVVEVLVGVSKAAMVYVGLNFRTTEAELDAVLSNAQARLLITEPEFQAMAERLAQAHGLVLLVLDEGEASGYVRGWKPFAKGPEQNWSYAIQWWAFAVVLLVLYVALNLKKDDGA